MLRGTLVLSLSPPQHSLSLLPCDCQEGEENITGCTCQARHSYTADDITWDMTFAPCVFLDKDEGGFVVDFDKFHDLVSAAKGSRPGPRAVLKRMVALMRIIVDLFDRMIPRACCYLAFDPQVPVGSDGAPAGGDRDRGERPFQSFS